MTESGAPAEPEDAQPARPARPQYGEYATPAEVAAARGIPLDRGANEHIERLSAPLPPPTPRHPARPPHDPRRPAGPPRARRPSSAAVGVTPRSSLPTVLLLVFGIWNTVSSVPALLDFGATLSEAFRLAGQGDVTFGPLAHTVGILLLVVSFLLTIAAIGWALVRIRAGLPSLRVPLIAGAVWIVAYLVGFGVIVANTPAVLALLENHS